MKKHLAVICGVYYPNPSPTGLCAKRFVEALSDEYDIDVICISDNGESETISQQNGLCIHTLTGKRFSAEAKATGYTKKALHILGAVQIKTRLLGNLTWFRSLTYKKLSQLQQQHSFDAVFSVCSPFAAHCAAKDFKGKHQNIKWCAYTVDPYSASNRIRPFLYSLKRLIKSERNVLLLSDSLLLSEEVYKSRSELYSGHKKCKPLPYMLAKLTTEETNEMLHPTDDINCVYAGSFYKDIRNPERMLQTFSMLGDMKIKLHLYSKGCEDIVNSFASDNIIVHPTVSHDEIIKVYHNADVLIGVGNTVSDFLPSKVFEYISACKPIVFFNSMAETNELLDIYPCQWQTTTAKNMESDVYSLRTFLNENGRRKVPLSDIEKIYGKYSASNISDILHNALK